jgi:hypothetical protein
LETRRENVVFIENSFRWWIDARHPRDATTFG